MADPLDRLRTALAGRYTLERELGAGGMAVVYLARDLKHDRPVALKVVRPELTALLGPERFLREIAITGRLQHPHILPLLDSGEADGLLYYVMPYVAGETLRQRLERERQLPVEEALRLVREVADALDYAHRQGVVHRDLKPENLLLEEGHAVVADFGIARAVEAAGGEKLTATGTVLGTPFYMSPEQAMGGVVDGRSDQYSLGCVLYELLAGTPPFVAPSAEGLVHQHLSVVPRLVTEVRPSVPGAVAAALQRALAKTAADRYETAGRFGESLGAAMPTPAPESGVGASVPPPNTAAGKPVRPRPRRALAGAVLLVLLAVGAFAAWRTGLLSNLVGGRSAPPAKKEWILVAEFEGPSDEPSLAAAARELVSAALDQSEIVATVPRGQLKEALRLAGKPDTTRVSGEVARELAYRGSIRAVVEGRIERLGKGYTIVIRAVDAEERRAILTVSDVAAGQEALIPSLGNLAKRLRAGLGENESAIRATRPLREAATPSFEAFQLYMRAVELQNVDADDRRSLALLHEALKIDPDFASAWGSKGFAHDHLGEEDSSRAAFTEALSRKNRLTEYQRLFFAGVGAQLNNDLSSADAIWQQLVRQNSNDAAALGNRAGVLGNAGRFEEALECATRAARIGPFAPRQWILNGQFAYQLVLGRLDEARETAKLLKGRNGRNAELGLAVAADDWKRADSVATAYAFDPTVAIEVRFSACLVSASDQAARGAIRGATRVLQQSQAMARGAGRADLKREAIRAEALLATAAGGVLGRLDSEVARDTLTTALITGGMWALANGDTDLARQILGKLNERPADELARHGASPTLLEGWMAARSGHWDETVRILAPAARQGAEIGYVTEAPGRVPMRWLVAEAYDRLGRPDSAAAFFELTLSAARMRWRERLPLRMISSMAHRRLVLLYTRMGRLEEARRHWEIFSATCTRPDPEMLPQIEEARAALVSAEAMAGGQQR